MSSLFNYIGYRYQRNPHRMAKYLGANQWEILGTIYTGSVTTVGGGKPTVGREYPAFCQDPDSWRGWAVLVRRESRVLRRDGREYWVCLGAGFSRSSSLSTALYAAEEVSTIALATEEVALVRAGPRGLLVFSGSQIVRGELEIEISDVVEISDSTWLIVETITGGYVLGADGNLTSIEAGTPSTAGPPPTEYSGTTHPGRWCLEGGGIGVG